MSTQTVESKDDLVHGLTALEIQKLGQRCTEAKERAYCKLPAYLTAVYRSTQRANTYNVGPYSHFKVGCALLPKNTQSDIIIGANVENAAYPVGTCAERVALGTAVVQGLKYGDLKALAVATNSAPGNPASPCGMCRQFIREFCEPETPIVMYDREGGFLIKTLEEVCLASHTGPYILGTDCVSSFYLCPLDQPLSPHRTSWTRSRRKWRRRRQADRTYSYGITTSVTESLQGAVRMSWRDVDGYCS